jgi:hypothetical protein
MIQEDALKLRRTQTFFRVRDRRRRAGGNKTNKTCKTNAKGGRIIIINMNDSNMRDNVSSTSYKNKSLVQTAAPRPGHWIRSFDRVIPSMALTMAINLDRDNSGTWGPCTETIVRCRPAFPYIPRAQVSWRPFLSSYGSTRTARYRPAWACIITG